MSIRHDLEALGSCYSSGPTTTRQRLRPLGRLVSEHKNNTTPTDLGCPKIGKWLGSMGYFTYLKEWGGFSLGLKTHSYTNLFILTSWEIQGTIRGNWFCAGFGGWIGDQFILCCLAVRLFFVVETRQMCRMYGWFSCISWNMPVSIRVYFGRILRGSKWTQSVGALLGFACSTLSVMVIYHGTKWSTKTPTKQIQEIDTWAKKTHTFHCTGCLKRILILASGDPCITE